MDDTESVDVPLLAVVEGTNARVTVETVDGSYYVGKMVSFDLANGNIELVDAKCQARDSSLSICERVCIKGSSTRLIHLPTEMKNAPLLDWRRDSTRLMIRKSMKRRKEHVKVAVKKAKEVDIGKKRKEKKLRKLH